MEERNWPQEGQEIRVARPERQEQAMAHPHVTRQYPAISRVITSAIVR
jgi:methionine-rich copper-binding protein CopC